MRQAHMREMKTPPHVKLTIDYVKTGHEYDCAGGSIQVQDGSDECEQDSWNCLRYCNTMVNLEWISFSHVVKVTLRTFNETGVCASRDIMNSWCKYQACFSEFVKSQKTQFT